MKPRRYLAAYLVWGAVALYFSLVCWVWAYCRIVRLALFFSTGLFVLVSASFFKDGVMREMKRLDSEGYERTVDKSGWQKATAIRIDKTYAYHSEIRALLEWWSRLNWVGFGITGVLFLLSIFC